MAVTHLWYGLAMQSTFKKEANWDTDDIYCMLTTATYAVNQDTHQYKDVSVTNEVSSANYTAGGFKISGTTGANSTLSYTGGTNIWALDADDAAWTTVTFTTRYAPVYDNTPASNKPLLSYVDMGADQTVSSANFTIQWAAAGIVQVTVSP